MADEKKNMGHVDAFNAGMQQAVDAVGAMVAACEANFFDQATQDELRQMQISLELAMSGLHGAMEKLSACWSGRMHDKRPIAAKQAPGAHGIYR